MIRCPACWLLRWAEGAAQGKSWSKCFHIQKQYRQPVGFIGGASIVYALVLRIGKHNGFGDIIKNLNSAICTLSCTRIVSLNITCYPTDSNQSKAFKWSRYYSFIMKKLDKSWKRRRRVDTTPPMVLHLWPRHDIKCCNFLQFRQNEVMI